MCGPGYECIRVSTRKGQRSLPMPTWLVWKWAGPAPLLHVPSSVWIGLSHMMLRPTATITDVAGATSIHVKAPDFTSYHTFLTVISRQLWEERCSTVTVC